MHNEYSIAWHPQSRYVAYDALADEWLEVDSKPSHVDDKFFRVDLDKKLNWRFRQKFHDKKGGDVPQITEDRIEKDLEALQGLLQQVRSRADSWQERR